MTDNLEIQRKAEKLAFPAKINYSFFSPPLLGISLQQNTRSILVCICKTIWVGGGGLWVRKH